MYHADGPTDIHDKANSRFPQVLRTHLKTEPTANRTMILHPVAAVTILSYPGMYTKCHKASCPLICARGRRLRR